MKDRRSKRAMFAITLIICATMYAVAATQQMTEEQFAAEMAQALEQDRLDQELADAMVIEARYRAAKGVGE